MVASSALAVANSVLLGLHAGAKLRNFFGAGECFRLRLPRAGRGDLMLSRRALGSAAARNRFPCGTRANSSWQTPSSKPSRANSLCICSWRCFAAKVALALTAAAHCQFFVGLLRCAANSTATTAFEFATASSRSAVPDGLYFRIHAAQLALHAQWSRASSGRPPVTMRPW